jgi:hypothetical protein
MIFFSGLKISDHTLPGRSCHLPQKINLNISNKLPDAHFIAQASQEKVGTIMTQGILAVQSWNLSKLSISLDPRFRAFRHGIRGSTCTRTSS